MKTNVAIIGAGPAGLLLSHLLNRSQIDNVVVEKRSRAHVLGRVRAGVLESGSVELLRQVGLGERMDREGRAHEGIEIGWGDDKCLFLDLAKATGRRMMAYGQSRVQLDLFEAHDVSGTRIFDQAHDVVLHDVETRPHVTFEQAGQALRIDAEYIVGCDGYHGVSRGTIPAHVLRTYEKSYPFGWLGILSETPPLPNIIYAQHAHGFALASMRNPMLSRYYVQCPIEDRLDDWPDDRFWNELLTRLPASRASDVVTGPSIEKSIAPVRSFVAEPMRYHRLFLAGDAAHVVPPTGAKGLNLAISDVFYLGRALAAHYAGDDHYLDEYSNMALRRVWGALRLSWSMTMLLHTFPWHSDFDVRIRENELEHLASNRAAQAAFSEQYVGLPFEE